jgi:hypothetical protein
MSTGKTKVKKWSYFLNCLENEPFLDGCAATAEIWQKSLFWQLQIANQ